MNDYKDGSFELSPDDQRMLDAFVESGFDKQVLEGLEALDAKRAQALKTLFELLEDYPVEDADDTLVHATMARVDRTEDDRAARMSFSNATEADRGTGRRIRLPDFLSVAAVILIGTSIIWPLSNHLHQKSIDSGCANNLRRMALAFDQYANDYNGLMPMAQAGFFGGWSPTTHNTINLGPLVRDGYCDHSHLACPGRHVTDGQFGDSYSYQWQVAGHRPVWGGGRSTLVLGDRNPLIDAAGNGQLIHSLSISLNHNGRGQNVLTTNGATIWLTEPTIGLNDNIWLPAGVIFLRAGDKLDDPSDAFLTH